MIVPKSGTVASSKPVNPESKIRSASAINHQGPIISTKANSATQGQCFHTFPNEFLLAAIANMITAAKAVLTKTKKVGETSTTAILMKKYGNPQIIESAIKRVKPFLVIVDEA
jgi:hypothetical protein